MYLQGIDKYLQGTLCKKASLINRKFERFYIQDITQLTSHNPNCLAVSDLFGLRDIRSMRNGYIDKILVEKIKIKEINRCLKMHHFSRKGLEIVFLVCCIFAVHGYKMMIQSLWYTVYFHYKLNHKTIDQNDIKRSISNTNRSNENSYVIEIENSIEQCNNDS